MITSRLRAAVNTEMVDNRTWTSMALDCSCLGFLQEMLTRCGKQSSTSLTSIFRHRGDSTAQNFIFLISSLLTYWGCFHQGLKSTPLYFLQSSSSQPSILYLCLPCSPFSLLLPFSAFKTYIYNMYLRGTEKLINICSYCNIRVFLFSGGWRLWHWPTVS